MKPLDYLTQEELVSLAKMALAQHSPKGIQEIARLAANAIPRLSLNPTTPPPNTPQPQLQPPTTRTESKHQAKLRCQSLLLAHCPHHILTSKTRSPLHRSLRHKAILAATIAGFHPNTIASAASIPVRRIYHYLSHQNPV